jgi:hypothetical protein
LVKLQGLGGGDDAATEGARSSAVRRSMPREKEYSPLREALYCPLLAPTNMFFSYGTEKATLPTRTYMVTNIFNIQLVLLFCDDCYVHQSSL